MRVRLPLVPAVTAVAAAVLLTGCAGDPEVAAPKTNVSFKPVPTVTAPTPGSTAPVNPGPGVIQWYGTGGEKLLHGLISTARSARGQHQDGKIVIDLGPCRTAWRRPGVTPSPTSPSRRPRTSGPRPASTSPPAWAPC